MNLDQIAPCFQCRLAVVQSVFHCDDGDPPDESPAGKSLLFQEWPDSRWFLQCGSCGRSEYGKPGDDQPTHRSRSPQFAAEIERLRIEVGWFADRLRYSPKPGNEE